MAITQFIVHGLQLSENMQHHKISDVRRILEEKGFQEDKEVSDESATHFTSSSGTGDGDTTIRFDDGGFVAEDGVSHSG